jgi:hypothetical protein
MLALALVAALLGADEPRLPINIKLSPRLAAIVADALRESPTLREQCERIGRIRRVRVYIDLDAPDEPTAPLLSRAHTNIKRYQFGAITAAIHLWSTRDVVELLAHELEHVSEYAEGINYHAESARSPDTVWATGPDTFETARAVLVGKLVAAEIAGRRPTSGQARRD